MLTNARANNTPKDLHIVARSMNHGFNSEMQSTGGRISVADTSSLEDAVVMIESPRYSKVRNLQAKINILKPKAIKPRKLRIADSDQEPNKRVPVTLPSVTSQPKHRNMPARSDSHNRSYKELMAFTLQKEINSCENDLNSLRKSIKDSLRKKKSRQSLLRTDEPNSHFGSIMRKDTMGKPQKRVTIVELQR